MGSIEFSADQMSFPDFIDQPSFPEVARERLPTNTTTNRHPVHRWFNFIAGFSPEFVQSCCERVGHKRGYLLDPFAGCGTSLVGALQYGLATFGYEPHPIFSRISRAKMPNPSWDNIHNIERIILDGLSHPTYLATLPEAPRTFLAKLFDQTVIESLLGARDSIISHGLVGDDLAFLILSRMLDVCSHSQTDGIYKAPSSVKLAQSPAQSCHEIVELIRSDVNTWTKSSQDGLLFNHSSESMPEIKPNSIDLVVTSPPYLNNFDFAEMTRMQLYFWEIANSWGEITRKVRSRLVVNTTTALAGHKDKQLDYREHITMPLHSRLDVLVSELRGKRAEKAGKKEYDLLVYPYFAQMTSVLRECFRVAKPNADVHIMIADAALYGIHISTPQFLAEIMESLGFRNVDCSLVRRRGHRWVLDKRDGSPLGLGEYHIQARK